MQNSIFDVQFDSQSGTIKSIMLCQDKHQMNWCAEDGQWGLLHHETFNDEFKKWRPEIEFKLLNFEQSDSAARSVYTNGYMQVTVERSFDPKGYLREKYILKNLKYADLFLSEHNFAIEVTFSDRYTYADECMARRCNAHIWCGHNTTYINALRMGVSEENVGLVVLRGAFDSYSVLGCESNNRGRFLLNIAPVELQEGEEHVIEWVIFPHTGKEDIKQKAAVYSSYIDIEAPHYTIFEGESIAFTAKRQQKSEQIRVYDALGDIPFTLLGDTIKVNYKPTAFGEYRIWVQMDECLTYADFVYKASFESLLQKRVRFIIEKQQYHREGSPLDGALLIYDNKQEHVIFEEILGDHTASRERLGMILLLGKYLESHHDGTCLHAFQKALRYVERELYDEATGNVFGDLGKDEQRVRLYNAPWVSTLFTQAYLLTGDKTYLSRVITLFQKYYQLGGYKFYPNGISMLKTAKAFQKAGMQAEYNEIVDMFRTHVDNMVKNKTSYPKHEVNFEQTIVSPAATFISEFAKLSGEERYVSEAKLHIEVLERFNGNQPSFHLNEIPIRYWNDFWFGDSMLFGDTFPHYWSCLSARSFYHYYNVSKNEKYLTAARECMRNCMCLFSEDGRGSAAYVYPYKLNKTFGEFYDNWANDQDFALYFALETGLLP